MTATASFDVADGMRIALVGGGKMGEAIMGGWIGAHEAPADVLGPENFVVANPGGERRSFLQERYGVACVDDARRIGPADLVLLAVKPQVMMGVLKGFPPRVLKRRSRRGRAWCAPCRTPRFSWGRASPP